MATYEESNYEISADAEPGKDLTWPAALLLPKESLPEVTGPVESYHRDLKPLLYLVLPQLKKMVGYTGCLIYDSQGQVLQSDHFLSVAVRHFVQLLGNSDFQKTEELLVQLSLKQTEPLVVDDFWNVTGFSEDDQPIENDHQFWMYTEVRGWCGIPLISRNQLIGVLVMRHTHIGYFSPEKIRQAKFLIIQAITAQSRLWSQAQIVGVLKERQRIARELHDSVTQVFYGIELGINTALTLLDRNSPQLKPQLQDVLALAEAGLAEMRALLTELHPAALETEGLVLNLLRQVEALRVRHGLEVTHNLEEEPAVPLLFKEALYRITQEAFNNIAKHAQASLVDLDLSQQGSYIKLEIKDNGRGFDPKIPRPGHLGQLMMRERAIDLGGRVEIISAPTQGTCVRAFIPLPAVKA